MYRIIRMLEHVRGLSDRLKEHRDEKKVIEAFSIVKNTYTEHLSTFETYATSHGRLYEETRETIRTSKEFTEAALETLELKHRYSVEATAEVFTRNKLLRRLITKIAL